MESERANVAPISAEADKPGDLMKYVGLWLFWAGLLAIVGSWFIPTAVDVEQPMEGLPSVMETTSVTNLARIQLQNMVLHSGIAAFLAGTIFYATGRVVGALSGLNRPK